ncbi:hypothetical protein ACIRPU_44090 [Streptomyces sp. NPDC102259]
MTRSATATPWKELDRLAQASTATDGECAPGQGTQQRHAELH